MTPKRPRDPNQLAKLVVDIATGTAPRAAAAAESSATESGRRGGETRAKRLSEERRKAIAKQAAKSRWGKGRPVRGEPINGLTKVASGPTCLLTLSIKGSINYGHEPAGSQNPRPNPHPAL